MTNENAVALKQRAYLLLLQVNQLRKQAREQSDMSPELEEQLRQAEQTLTSVEAELATSENLATAAKTRLPQDELPDSGRIVDTEKQSNYLSSETTGLDVQVNLRMPYVPTAIYHLLDRNETPLISCKVRNGAKEDTILRVRVISYIEHYSAQAVETIELKRNDFWVFNQLPTLLHDRVRDLTEITRATLNILVENLDGKVELHKTEPIWLMAHTTALNCFYDPTNQKYIDLTPYWGAFVTPNVPEVMAFVRVAAEHAPCGAFISYFGGEAAVEGQVRAIFDALKEHKLTYVHSWVSFGPNRSFQFHQRVRPPRESLKDRQANCIDGALLFASLLEAISLSAAIVLFRDHAFVAWETNGKGNDQWRFLETTMIGTESFENACASAEKHYKLNSAQAQLLKLRELRSQEINPME